MSQTAIRVAVVGLTLALLSSIALAGGYLLTFDGTPPAPLAYRPSMSFDSAVHVNDDHFTAVNAGHGPACEAPPAMHVVQTFDDAVFQCKGHIMTSLYAPGYGAIYLTPNQLLDFSAGEAVLQFDVSTLRTSDRDWIDLWITPWADQLELPLDNWLPDLNGDPRNAIHIKMDNVSGGSAFRAYVIRNFAVTELPLNDFGIEQVLTTSASIRTTFELRLSTTGLSFGMPATNSWWHLNNTFAPLSWTAGVVQFGHHSYNPMKNGGTNTPDTWHWDNFSISPAVPFTIIESDRRRADATAPALTFAAPAPGGSNLRFDARGSNIQVSFDGGASWQAAGRQAVAKADQEEVFKSYWMPMPTGATGVTFKGTDWFAGPWAIRDTSIFSLAAPGTTGPPPAPQTVVAPDASFHSSWVDQSATAPLLPGGVADLFVRFRNTGSSPWVKGVAGQQANLGISGDDPSFGTLGIGWLAPDRPAAQTEATVAPGQVGTFRFTVRAPATPGTYDLHLRPVIDGVTWMEDQGVTLSVTSDFGYHSAWLSQSPYPTLRPGEVSGPVTIAFRNTGSQTWLRGALGQQANLGINLDDRSWSGLDVSWASPDRPAVQTETSVAPGGTATFTFQVRAPAAPGTYVIHLRPVIDGTTWMEDQGVFLVIEVAN